MRQISRDAWWLGALVLAGCPADVHRPAEQDQVDDVAQDVAGHEVGADVSADVPLSDNASTDTATVDAATDTGPSDSAPPFDVAVDTASDPGTDPGSDPGTDPGGTDVPPDVSQSGKVAVFMAQGHVGRTMMSCDDGQTWVNNRSYDTEGDAHVCGNTSPVTCFTDGFPCTFWSVDNNVCEDPAATSCDCDHHPGAGNGIAFGADYFVGTWGWGPKGSLRRTSDGVNLEMVVEGTTFAGVGYGQGRFIAGSRWPRLSDDGGATWTDGTPIDLQSPAGDTIWNARTFAWVDVDGGRWVITGEDGGNRDVQVSSDNGETWWRPTTLPAECGTWARGIAGGNGHIVIVHGQGQVCASSDGGTRSSCPI